MDAGEQSEKQLQSAELFGSTDAGDGKMRLKRVKERC